MTEREIRKELLEISEEIASYDFIEVDESTKNFIESAPIQKAFWLVLGGVNNSEFLQEEFSERLEKIEKALKDLWLLA